MVGNEVIETPPWESNSHVLTVTPISLIKVAQAGFEPARSSPVQMQSLCTLRFESTASTIPPLCQYLILKNSFKKSLLTFTSFQLCRIKNTTNYIKMQYEINSRTKVILNFEYTKM